MYDQRFDVILSPPGLWYYLCHNGATCPHRVNINIFFVFFSVFLISALLTVLQLGHSAKLSTALLQHCQQHFSRFPHQLSSKSSLRVMIENQRRCEPQSNGAGMNFENLPMRIGVRIRRVRCKWWQLEAAQKGDWNCLPLRANVFFMIVKNL